MQIKCDANNNAVSLNKIINMMLDDTETGQRPSQSDYIKSNDQIIMSEIKKYSQDISNAGLADKSGNEYEEMIERMSESLFDAVSTANLDYLQHGMKLGAKLLLELLI